MARTAFDAIIPGSVEEYELDGQRCTAISKNCEYQVEAFGIAELAVPDVSGG